VDDTDGLSDPAARGGFNGTSPRRLLWAPARHASRPARTRFGPAALTHQAQCDDEDWAGWRGHGAPLLRPPAGRRGIRATTAPRIGAPPRPEGCSAGRSHAAFGTGAAGAGSIAGHAERRPQPCPSPCSTFHLQALITFHWCMLSLSSWRDAPASRRSLSDGFGGGAVDQHDSRLARLFLLPSSDTSAAACSRAGIRRASATRRRWWGASRGGLCAERMVLAPRSWFCGWCLATNTGTADDDGLLIDSGAEEARCSCCLFLQACG